MILIINEKPKDTFSIKNSLFTRLSIYSIVIGLIFLLLKNITNDDLFDVSTPYETKFMYQKFIIPGIMMFLTILYIKNIVKVIYMVLGILQTPEEKEKYRVSDYKTLNRVAFALHLSAAIPLFLVLLPMFFYHFLEKLFPYWNEPLSYFLVFITLTFSLFFLMKHYFKILMTKKEININKKVYLSSLLIFSSLIAYIPIHFVYRITLTAIISFIIFVIYIFIVMNIIAFLEIIEKKEEAILEIEEKEDIKRLD